MHDQTWLSDELRIRTCGIHDLSNRPVLSPHIHFLNHKICRKAHWSCCMHLLYKQPPTESSATSSIYLVTQSVDYYLCIICLLHVNCDLRNTNQTETFVFVLEMCATQWCIVLGQLKVNLVWSLCMNYTWS